MKRKTKNQDYGVIGFDSETLQGPPITFQFYSEEHREINGCVFIKKNSAVQTFLKQLGKLKPGRYRMYGHNLEFDMLSALWEKRAKIRDGEINLSIGSWSITGRYSKPVFAIFDDGHRYIELVDSFLWFMTSLDKASALVCPHLPKLTRPAGLGITNYQSSDKAFVAYAMRDAEVAYFLGRAIEGFHEELDIPPQISLASMAAAVFRLHYMRKDIYQPPLYQWMVGAAAAYHGGVNRVKSGAAPAWHINVSALDFSSAYPKRMAEFPAFSDAAGYRSFKKTKKMPKEFPELGTYCISGSASDCHWPALFDHNFKPLKGKFEDNWVTGVELNSALQFDEVKLSAVAGYYYESKRDTGYSPFNAYVYEFYARKSDSALDKVTQYMYKILLNALTGKFIQTSPDYTLADGKLVAMRRAGGLYHPFIAGQITGDTRVMIHGAEHEYDAIHTATDGIFIPGHVDPGNKKTLGALVCEGHGDLALFRNKLYIFYTDEEEDGFPSQAFADKYIQKCARHGFQGTVGDLEGMAVSSNRTYRTNKPIKLKTALDRGDVPNKFVIESRQLRNVDNLKVIHHA
jgi:hypothetical protein